MRCLFKKLGAARLLEMLDPSCMAAGVKRQTCLFGVKRQTAKRQLEHSLGSACQQTPWKSSSPAPPNRPHLDSLVYVSSLDGSAALGTATATKDSEWIGRTLAAGRPQVQARRKPQKYFAVACCRSTLAMEPEFERGLRISNVPPSRIKGFSPPVPPPCLLLGRPYVMSGYKSLLSYSLLLLSHSMEQCN